MAIIETISVEAGGAISQLDALAAAADKTAAAFDKLKTGAAGGASFDKMAASMDAAASKIEASVAKIEASFSKLAGAGDGAGAGLDKVGAAADSAAGPLDAAAAAADAAAAAQDRLAGSADAGAAAMDRQAASGERAGAKSAAGAEAGAAGFAKFSKTVLLGFGVAAAYGIDKAMGLNAEVTRLYTAAGLTHAPFQQVQQDMLKIGSQTGYTGEQIAQAMYHPVSAGLNLATSLGLVTQAANLANIHGANLEDTTYALSSVMKAYNQSTKDVVPTAALLNSIVGQGDMRFQDFNQSVKNWAPTGASMGISIQSMGAGLAYLTDRGNSAEVASTRMTMGLSMVTAGSKEANTFLKSLGLTTGSVALRNESLAQVMNKYGLTTNKIAADLKKPDGLYVALTDLQHAFHASGLTAAQSDQVMAKLFGGGRSDKAILSLMSNLDGLKQKYDQITQGVNGYQASVAKEQATPQQKWKDLTSGLQNAATGFGLALLPAFSAAAGFASKILSDLNGSKGAWRDIAVGAGGLAAVFTANKLASGVKEAFATGEAGLRGIGKLFNISGLANLGKSAGAGAATAGLEGAATSLDGSATALDGAAEALSGAAGKLDVSSTMSGTAAGESAAVRAETAAAQGWPVTPEMLAAKHGATAAEAAPAGLTLSSLAKGILPALGPAMAMTALNQASASEAAKVARAVHAPQLHQNSMASQAVYSAARNMTQQVPVIGPVLNAISSFFGASAGKPLASATSTGLPSYATVTVAGVPGYSAGLGPFGGFAPSMATQAARAQAGPAWSGGSDQLSAGHAAATMKLPSPDTSALEQAKAKVESAMTAIDSAISKANAHPGKIPAPDMAALEQAKTKVAADMTQINAAISKSESKPGSIPAPNLANLTSAAGKAQAAGQAIQQAVDKALARPAVAAPPNLSAYTSAIGAATGDGVAVGAWFASGIASQAAAAAGAAAAVASAATVAFRANLQIHSPSKVTTVIGEQTGTGLAQGITKSTAKVKAAAITMSAATVTSLTQGLQGGKTAIDAALTALTGKGSRPQDQTTIAATIQTLENNVASALKKGIISKPEDSALVKMLSQDNTKLQGLAAQRAKLEQEITNSQQITTSQISSMSIMNAGQYVPALGASNGPQSAITTITGMQYQAQDQQNFASQLQQLQKMGLNSQSLSQLSQAGAQAGLPIAEGIAQGGKQAVAQMNKLEAQIVGSAAKIGAVGGPAMYDAAQQVTAGLSTGLTTALSGIDAAMTKMATQIVAMVKKELKIASPSQVFADEVGAMIPAGVAVGIRRGEATAISAAQQMSARMAAAGRAAPPGGFGGGSSGGGGDTHYHTYNVTVQGNVTAEQDLLESLRGLQLSHASQNWQSGWNLPGKAA